MAGCTSSSETATAAPGGVNRLLDDQETMIGAVLIGYNVLNILSSALATEFITQVVPGAWGVAIATGVMTLLVVVFVEVMPKTLAIVRADDVARAVSRPCCWWSGFSGR